MAGTEVASLYARVSADVSDFGRSMDQVKRDMTDAESGMSRFGSVIGNGLKIAAGVGVAAVAGIGAAIGGATLKAREFEQGIADIGAMMNLTADDTAKLEDHIMDLGLDPNLKVSADEASGAVMALGTAGLDLQQIMKGASKATVLMANATGLKGKEGFATAATIATDVMAQFKIEAEDMEKAVSAIAGTTVASKFSIQDYQLALAQAGGVASAVGVSFEDFNATIAAISPSFASGSDAGTSFKTFLQRLIPTTSDAKDAMYQLDLLTTDWAEASADLSHVLGREVAPNAIAVYEAFQQTASGAAAAAEGKKALGKAFQSLRVQYEESAFFDEATGKMKDMDEIAGALQTAFAGLTEEQKNEAAATIFGTDAMRAAFGVIDAGTEGINEMSTAIESVNAGDLAAKRMDTLSGSWEIFLGVVETLALKVGAEFLPIARDLVTWATEMAQTHGPAIVQMATNIAAGIGTMVENIKGFLTDLRAKWDADWAGMQTTVTEWQFTMTQQNATFWYEWNRTFGSEVETNTNGWEVFWAEVLRLGADAMTNFNEGNIRALRYMRLQREIWGALFTGDWQTMWNSIGDLADMALSSITDKMGAWGFEARNVIIQSLLNVWEGMKEVWELVRAWWNNSFGRLLGLDNWQSYESTWNPSAGVVNPGNLSPDRQMEYLNQNWDKYETPYTSPMPTINSVNITVPAASDPYQQGVLIGNGIGDELRRRGYQ